MVSTTRSGRIRRDDKEVASDSVKLKDIKSSTTPGSATTNRRSERIDKQTPAISPPKRKSEAVEKETLQSTLRRSGRLEEKSAASSSSSSKKSSGSSPSGSMKTKKSSSSEDTMEEMEEKKTDKTGVVEVGEPSRKLGVKGGSEVSKKKKRLDARSYRAFLKSQTKKSKVSEVVGCDERKRSGETVSSVADDTKEVDDGDECNGRKGDLGGKCFEGDGKIAVKEYSSGSRELGTAIDDVERESTYYCRKRKFRAHEVSKYSGISLEPSLGELIVNQTVGDANGAEACCLATEDLETQTPQLIESTSEERSVALDVDVEVAGVSGTSKRSKIAIDLGSDISVAPINDALFIHETSSANAFSSASRSKYSELCAASCKQQRGCSEFQDHEICSCNAKTSHDLSNTHSEKVCEPAAMSRCPHKDEVLANYFKKDNAEGNSVQEAKEKSAGALELNDILIDSPNAIDAAACMEEDRGRLEVRGTMGFTEQLGNTTRLKEFSLNIQPDSGHNACIICKHPGLLLFCDGKGCKRSYHLSCIDPPLKVIPPGIWHCLCCVRKKIESGVHSVSEGMESVLDARVVELPGSTGMQKEKQYLVKYKGLAHVHNRWVSENELLLEAPMFIAKFNRKHQEKVIMWKKEWTMPHRLLQKRLLLPPKLADECFGGHGNEYSHFYYEWFVKWTGLGYEHATWEFENSQFLRSPEAMALINDFENRRIEAKKASDPSKADKALQVRKNPFTWLLRIPDGFPSGLDNDHLNSVNKLRECWHKTQNAVLIDDQERIIKVILFILALKPDVCRPFLIISTSNFRFLWESEFMRLAPSINVVVYSGTKDARKLIRTLEFYEEGGCIMFQVLLAPPEAIVEDIETLDCVGWEAVIIDECQCSRVSKHFVQFNKLSSDFRLLLSFQMKENVDEYYNLLSFLESGGNNRYVDGLKIDSDDTAAELAILKERLARYLVNERKPDSLKFLEYWVPVRLSNVQLEQYCATLISNAMTLRSFSKIDLHDILISTRKCCDHPFLVDKSLATSLVKGLQPVEFLDVGVNASGKLQLLDKILQEMKNQGLRAVILFQFVGGDKRSSIGDYLDDFLHQRFGLDSYERVDSGLVNTRRLAALNMFNQKERGRFVFLIENRACLPSIKLSSVDAVIIFGSDWNPLNDIRALQRISIGSQFEQIKVFRLYSSFTVEEKVLILGKQDVILDNSIQNINRSVSHSLLSWGASYLFNELDEFHSRGIPSSASEISSEKSFSNDVVSELLNELQHNAGGNCSSSCSFVLKVQQSGANYSRNNFLLGEKEMSLPDEDPPHVFWSKLLDGRYPQWRYVSGLSQRIRRKVQYYDPLQKQSVTENGEAKKKRRKVVVNTTDPISLQPCLQDNRKEFTGIPFGKGTKMPVSPAAERFSVSPLNMKKEPGSRISRSPASIGSQCSPRAKASRNDSEERKKLRNAQRNLHLLLKPEISKLCETLQLQVEVKAIAEMFLEHIMNNHQVSREPETILQAFKISLCWRAASFLKIKVDHKESLELAKKYLNFECKEEEAESVYSKLRMLKKKFSCRSGASVNAIEPNSLGSQLSSPRTKDIAGDPLHAKTSDSATSDNHELEEGEIRESPKHRRVSELQFFAEQDKVHVHETAPMKLHQKIGSSKDDLLNKHIKMIEKTCSKRMDQLLLKQRSEVDEFFNFRNKEDMKMNKARDLNLDLIRIIHSNPDLIEGKINLLNQGFSKRMVAFDKHMKSQRGKQRVMHLNARNGENNIKKHWLQEANAGRLAESFGILPLSDSGFRPEEFKGASEQFDAFDSLTDMIAFSGSSSDQQNSNEISSGLLKSLEPNRAPAEPPTIVRNGGTQIMPVGTEILAAQANKTNEVTNGYGGIHIATAYNTVVGKQGTKDNFEGACQTSSLGLKQSELPSLELTSTRSISQVSSVDNEWPAVSDVLGSEQGLHSLQPVVASAFQSAGAVPSQVLPSNDNLMISYHVQLQPPCTDCPSVEPVQVNTAALVEPSDTDLMVVDHIQSQCTALPLVEHDQVNTSEQVESSGNNLVVSDTIQVLPPSTELPSVDVSKASTPTPTVGEQEPSNEPHTSQTEASIQQPDKIMSLQDDLPSVEYVQENTAAHVEPCSSNVLVVDPQLQHPQLPLVEHDHVNTCAQAETSGNDLMVSDPIHLRPPCTNLPSGDLSQASTSAAIEGEPEPSNVLHTSQTEVLMQQPTRNVALQAEQSDHVSQTVVNQLLPHTSVPLERMLSEDLRSTDIVGETSVRLLQTFPVTARLHPQELHADPLQNELMRIRREEDLVIQICEDSKLRLKSECEKEIEKVRKKYDTLLQETETAFSEKKKELDIIYRKVHMNLILAEEFRSKFSDIKAATAPAAFQGTRSSFMHQVLQVSQPQSAQGPALTSASAQVSHAEPASTSTRPRAPSQVPGLATAIASVPPVQVVYHAPALFSSNPVRPHFNPVLPPRGSLQVGSEFRTMAPHLHPFRPQTSTSAPNLPLQASGMLNQQQLLNNQVSPSSMPPLVANISPTCPSRDAVSGTLHLEASGVPAFPSTSVSLVNLLAETGANRIGSNVQNLPYLPASGPTVDSWLSSDLAVARSVHSPSGMDGARLSASVNDNIRPGAPVNNAARATAPVNIIVVDD